jgi:hypothetical protein
MSKETCAENIIRHGGSDNKNNTNDLENGRVSFKASNGALIKIKTVLAVLISQWQMGPHIETICSTIPML